MKRTAVLVCALGALLLSGAGLAAQILPDTYQAVSQFLNPDPNTGLTTFRSLLIPMGGLEEGMGTAYTAVSKDSSYFEANPAASSTLDFTELAIYHNNWIADTKIEGAVYTIRTKQFGFGAAGKWLYLPFTAYDQFGDRQGAGYYSEAMAGFNVSYNFLPGYYFSGIAVGATGKLAYRAVPDVANGATAGNSALGEMVDLGMLTRFDFGKFDHWRGKNFSIGLALKNLGPPVLGDPLPTTASFGLAYSPLRPTTFSLDVSKPINLLDPALSENMAVAGGFLIDVTSFFRMQGGLLIKGGNPRLTVGSSVDFELMRVAVNYTLDLTTQLTPLNRISIQASFLLGDLGRADLAKKVDTLYLNGLEAYANGDNAKAEEFWKEALTLDPTFDPAKESLHAALSAEQLKQTMDELGKINPATN
ncbi:MAG TPA: UPF0164 family protein [Rectinemataceae bacterium]|nr:UPF0164 family protein [Rectinemataceae bacterium]